VLKERAQVTRILPAGEKVKCSFNVSTIEYFETPAGLPAGSGCMLVDGANTIFYVVESYDEVAAKFKAA
jgi:hypothetical protein